MPVYAITLNFSVADIDFLLQGVGKVVDWRDPDTKGGTPQNRPGLTKANAGIKN
jgi:hypothetical protein